MNKLLTSLLALVGAAAVSTPAQASISEQEHLDQAKSLGTIEALEDFAYRFPHLKHAVAVAEAKFLCASGQTWKCGADGQPDPRSNRYGG